MAIDLYGEKPIGALQGVAQRQLQAGQQIGQQMFGQRGMGQASLRSALGRYQKRIDEAIEAWGIDALINWKENGAQLRNAVRQDLQQMRQEAMKARAANDMDRYKIALQRVMFDKEMDAYADALDKARAGDIITAIIGGLGQIAAGIGERITGRKLEARQRTELGDWMKRTEWELKPPFGPEQFYRRSYGNY